MKNSTLTLTAFFVAFLNETGSKMKFEDVKSALYFCQAFKGEDFATADEMKVLLIDEAHAIDVLRIYVEVIEINGFVQNGSYFEIAPAADQITEPTDETLNRIMTAPIDETAAARVFYKVFSMDSLTGETTQNVSKLGFFQLSDAQECADRLNEMMQHEGSTQRFFCIIDFSTSADHVDIDDPAAVSFEIARQLDILEPMPVSQIIDERLAQIRQSIADRQQELRAKYPADYGQPVSYQPSAPKGQQLTLEQRTENQVRRTAERRAESRAAADALTLEEQHNRFVYSLKQDGYTIESQATGSNQIYMRWTAGRDVPTFTTFTRWNEQHKIIHFEVLEFCPVSFHRLPAAPSAAPIRQSSESAGGI